MQKLSATLLDTRVTTSNNEAMTGTGSHNLSPLCSRRGFLKGVAIATAATASGALLAACAGESVVAEASKADIPVGGAIIIDKWIIAQPKKGEFTAYSTSCPHAGGTIDKIEEVNGQAVAICPKHNSHFDLATGDVLSGPSRDPMKSASSVTESGDKVEVKS
ncbi:Rieske (2Fe-2S) protein [Corynebacterium anserum]|uniref:Rieske (2Fe-2S) protein n=1 Tax=Corynebacterium anserum TaxID=2684406 RepID=UPI0028BD6D0E|nr:Rieske (2Fe-2S) protein [Corynebacterium anserum]